MDDVNFLPEITTRFVSRRGRIFAIVLERKLPKGC